MVLPYQHAFNLAARNYTAFGLNMQYLNTANLFFELCKQCCHTIHRIEIFFTKAIIKEQSCIFILKKKHENIQNVNHCKVGTN